MKALFNWTAKLGAAMLLFFLTPSLSHAQAAYKDGQKVTVKGEVLDMACYMSAGKHGPGHASCAQMCIKGGAPMGVLDSKGNVFLMVEDHSNADPYAKLKGYAAKNVSVTGTYYDRGGTQGVVVESIQAD